MKTDVTKSLILGLLICAAIFMPLVGWAQGEGAATGGQDGDQSIFSLIVKGGPVMVPLAIASIFALALAIERYLSLKRDKIIPPDFMAGLREAMRSSGNDPKAAVDYCENAGGPVGEIFRAGVKKISMGVEHVEKAIEDAGAKEVEKLKRRLKGLAVVAEVAPLMGLLGTVYGMIEAFQRASAAGMGKADVLAKGIYEALVTTATGLTIAIPVLLVYQHLNSKINAAVDEIDEMGTEFIEGCIHESEEKSQ